MVQSKRGAMDFTRASFLKGAGAAGLYAVFAPRLAQAQSPPALPIEEIADGIFVHNGVHALSAPDNRGDICNVGFIVGTSAVAVVDTGGSAPTGAALLAAIRQKTTLPITHVVNTHMHPDHVLGNAAFAAEKPVIVGHHKLLRALAERTDSYLEAAKEQLGEAAFAGTAIVLPTLGVETETTIDLGGREIRLTARPTAHTNNDLTIRDSRTNTVFMGDLIFSGHLPSLDGSLRGWIKLLDVMEKEPADRIVPGHGPAHLPWPAGAADIRRYLETLAADVRKAIADGKTMTDAMATAGQSEKPRWSLFEEYNARNVSAAFAELEWE